MPMLPTYIAICTICKKQIYPGDSHYLITQKVYHQTNDLKEDFEFTVRYCCSVMCYYTYCGKLV